VTLIALTRIVVGRPIGRVARLTIREAGMIERRGLPRIRRVTLTALTWEMIGGLIDGMAHGAVGQADMIDDGRLPGRC
jgi:hypothetical protein